MERESESSRSSTFRFSFRLCDRICEKNGKDGWNLFEQLKKNEVTVAGANQEALDPVVTGAKDMVIAGVDYMTYSAKAKGEPVDIVYPKSGTVISPRAAGIMKDSKM